MNDVERSRWIDNDKFLHRVWKKSGMSKRKYIRELRPYIDDYIARKIK